MADVITLSKGEDIDLTKAAPSLVKLIAGAGWDAKAGKKIDLDLFGVYLGDDGKAIPDANANGTNADEALCFFNHKVMPGMKSSGDNQSGEGEGDDEQITITLADVPAEAKKIALAVGIYKGAANLGEIENVSVRMVNAEGMEELAKFTTADGLNDKQGVVLGHVERTDDGWKFTASGEGLSGSFDDIVKGFGVTGF